MSIFALSCKEQEQDRKSFFIYDKQGQVNDEMIFGRHAQSMKRKIMASSDWNVSHCPDWLVVSPDSGTKGSRLLELKVSVNSSEENRSGEVVFSMGQEPVHTLKVIQYGKEQDEMPEPDLDKKGKTADLLDVVFDRNGSAKDVSQMEMPIQHLPGLSHMNYFSSPFNRFVASFHHSGETAHDSYYRIDYRENDKFIRGLADGHSMEMVFSCKKKPSRNGEWKMFSTHDAGGTGFLVSDQGKGSCITFLPNVSENGSSHWVWTKSGVVPEAGQFYHVVGVWNKEQAKSYIYVNGKLCGEAEAKGDLVMPKNPKAWWLALGADSSESGGQCAWGGELAVARIFDDPLSAQEVADLYEDVRKGQQTEGLKISEVEYLSNCRIPTTYWYHIFGEGFEEGDQIRFTSIDGEKSSIDCKGVVKQGEIGVQIPSSMVSDRYSIVLRRGNLSYPIGPVDLTIGQVDQTVHKTQVVAHRCWHNNGLPENSFAALVKSQELGIWGSEIDVWITKDDVVLVNHNKTFPTDPGKRQIQYSQYSDFRDVRLANGEVVPTLEGFLKQIKKEPGMNLVLEIKTHDHPEDTRRVVDKCIDMVLAEHVTGQVVWIAFDYESCKHIAASIPGCMVQYLGGDKSPSQCFDDGIKGIDYSGGKLKDEWIEEAHRLGMKVNVWTINDLATMTDFIAKGVDYITTDKPDVLKNILSRKFVTEE